MREMWVSKVAIVLVTLFVIGLFLLNALAEILMMKLIDKNDELREQLGEEQEESGEDSDNDSFFNGFGKND